MYWTISHFAAHLSEEEPKALKQPRDTACFLLMGGNFSKTRALGSWTAPPTATGSREEQLGLETVTIHAPVPGTAMHGWLFPSTGPSCSPGMGLKGSPLQGGAGVCCCLTRLFLMGCMLDTSPGGLRGEMRK